ncbi:hypothetical protein [Mycobacterium sp. IS-836]|uniref:hypothetical protein n=1 Tax=Mycobacterium sp. IS-836 TaxID=1834160 RepID=UPI001151FB9B|nr:hypothetical protein [Mycobacterium sp. IS-836]
MPKRLSAWAPIIALGMIVAGGLGCLGVHGPCIRQLTRYAFGDPAIGEHKTQLSAAIVSDVWFFVAYGLVLGGCAWFYRVRASSQAGRGIGAFVIAAVIIAVVANVVEDVLLWITLTHDGNGLRTAAQAAATVKFCMMAVGAVGVLASIGIVLRDAMAWYRRLSIWHSCKGVSIPQMLRSVKGFRWMKTDADAEPLPAPWWDDVLAPDDLPKPTETQEAVKKAVADSGQTAEAVIENQQRWLHAYSVPGVTDALKGRTEPLRALCLSGGGVRSACVALGAMQVFSKPSSASDAVAKPSGNGSSAATLLDGLDYVISVSGGGYAAGARLLAVQDKQVDPGQTPEEKAAHENKPRPLPNVVPISKRFEEGSAEFDHIRSRSSYIADSPLGLLRALAEVLKNLVASLATIFTVPVIAGAALGWLLARIPIAAFPPVPAERAATDPNNGKYFPSLVAHPAAYWAIGFFAAFAVLFTMYTLVEEWKSSSRRSEGRQLRALRWARASAGFALVIFTLTIALPGLMRLCSGAGGHAPSSPGGAFAALSGVVGLNYVAALIAMIWRDKNKLVKSAGIQTAPGLLKRILPPQVISLLLTVATLAVLLVVWLALLGSFAAGAFHYCAQNGLLEHLAHMAPSLWWLAGVTLTWLFVGFADVTSLSLHPFYRRRLAHTFAVRRAPDTGVPNEAVRYRDDEPTWLHWYGRTTNGPQFVFACSATITGPDRPAPGLNAVSYVMSADYVGGPALGWFHTEKLFEAAPPRIRRDLTVEAAIAVSGAAFASAMGRQNKGIEKLLAVSGARLGTWLPNPSFVAQLRDAEHRNDSDPDPLCRTWPKSLPTIRGGGYLYREILGINNIDARLVQITDGGHYDNSGLVEALRRRCGLIFVVDGGGDPPPLPIGLTDAIRLAKYELGVEITLNQTGPYSVESITPGSGKKFAKDDALASLNGRITRGAVVNGDITYPAAAGLEKSTGILIFAKAVLCEACPYWLLTYAASSDIFPHDPTSDQWFSEGQFAAYTELGRVIADQAVKCVTSLQPAVSGTRRRPVSVP